MIKLLTKVIDFFYIKQLRFIPHETFRYAAVGGINLLTNYVVYYLCYNFLLHQKDTDFGIVTISGPILSIFITFLITAFPGYWLVKNLAFSGSYLKSRSQLFRYAQVAGVNILINYFGVKLLHDVIGIFATPSYIIVSFFTVIFSYLMQRFYSFRGHKKL